MSTKQPTILTETKLLELAEVAHEINRAYCASLGDHTQPHWKDAPAWQKDSIRAGVEARLLNPEMLPERAHEMWMSRKIDEGWTYAATKNVEAKQHPCMLPYSELPPEQRAKDDIFAAVVRLLS